MKDRNCNECLNIHRFYIYIIRLYFDKKESPMSKIKIGSHVKMAGKEMFLASVKEAESYGANVLMLYTGAPRTPEEKTLKS